MEKPPSRPKWPKGPVQRPVRPASRRAPDPLVHEWQGQIPDAGSIEMDEDPAETQPVELADEIAAGIEKKATAAASNPVSKPPALPPKKRRLDARPAAKPPAVKEEQKAAETETPYSKDRPEQLLETLNHLLERLRSGQPVTVQPMLESELSRLRKIAEDRDKQTKKLRKEIELFKGLLEEKESLIKPAFREWFSKVGPESAASAITAFRETHETLERMSTGRRKVAVVTKLRLRLAKRRIPSVLAEYGATAEPEGSSINIRYLTGSAGHSEQEYLGGSQESYAKFTKELCDAQAKAGYLHEFLGKCNSGDYSPIAAKST